MTHGQYDDGVDNEEHWVEVLLAWFVCVQLGALLAFVLASRVMA